MKIGISGSGTALRMAPTTVGDAAGRSDQGRRALPQLSTDAWPDRRHFILAATGAVTGTALFDGRALASDTAPPSAIPSESDRLNQPGPEARMLASRVGLWDVTETVWDAPDAAPKVTRGLIAERFMIGVALQEFIRFASDTTRQSVKRTDFLCYNRLDGRWDYLSFDTRVPVGLMPAYSLARGNLDRIDVAFLPFALVGLGPRASGQMLRMRQAIINHGADHDVKDQFFTLADGTGSEFLAHRYDYARKS